MLPWIDILDAQDWAAIAQASWIIEIASLGPSAEDAVPNLKKLAVQGNEATQILASGALLLVAPSAANAETAARFVPKFLEIAQDEEEWTPGRIFCVRVLQQLGARASAGRTFLKNSAPMPTRQ